MYHYSLIEIPKDEQLFPEERWRLIYTTEDEEIHTRRLLTCKGSESAEEEAINFLWEKFPLYYNWKLGRIKECDIQPKEKRPYFIAQVLGTGEYNYFLVHIPGLDTFKRDTMHTAQEQVEARYPEYSWYQGDYQGDYLDYLKEGS